MRHFLPDPWMLVVFAVSAPILFGTGYLKGGADARATIAVQLKSDRITILQDGKEIDDAVFAADDTGLCALLGGCKLPDNAGGN